MALTDVITNAVQNVQKVESRRKGFIRKLEPLKSKDLGSYNSKELLETRLVKKITPEKLNCKMAGADSGFLGKSLHALDIFMIRTSAAVFTYSGDKLAKAHYLPCFYEFPVPELSSQALERDEYMCSSSLKRLSEEVRISQRAIKEHKPDYMLLDGSIIPQFADKPRKDSVVINLYRKLISEFESLYETASGNKCNLVACVKDSRGSRFRSILQDEILPHEPSLNADELDDCFDSNLLDYLLNEGERSIAFHYSKSVKEHPILADFSDKWTDSVYVLYMKPSSLDRPLRVEFLYNGPKEKLTEYADKISSVIYSSSSLHKEFAYPSVLIEADLRARLRPEEVNTVYDKIVDKLGRGSSFLLLRRNSRPFG